MFRDGGVLGKTEIPGRSGYMEDTNESLHLTQAGDGGLDCGNPAGGKQDPRGMTGTVRSKPDEL